MARIRSIHPSFFTDDAVLSCTMAARMLYIGLWVEADCQGVFEWRPVQLKVRLLPIDDVNVPELLEELVAADLIQRFDAGGKPYGAVKDFRQFQRPKNPTTLYPLPPSLREYVGLDVQNGGNGEADGDQFPQETRPKVVQLPQRQAVKSGRYPQRGENLRMEGREGEGVREGKGVGRETAPPKRGARLHDNWQPSPELVAYGVGLGFPADKVLNAAERFRLHWLSSAGRNAVKLNWDQAFQGWLRDDRDRRGVGKSPTSIKVF